MKRIFEFFLIYCMGPLLILYFNLPLLTSMLIASCVMVYVLKKDTYFYKSLLKKPSLKEYELVITQWLLISIIFFYLTYQIAPNIFLKPILDNHLEYLGGVIVYGFLSVLPQMIIFRSYLFKRYSFITKDWKGIVLSAIIFSYAHIVLGNYFALILTFFGGMVLSYRYVKTGSFRIVWFEHLLYGAMIFGTGLDFFFYTPLILQ